MFTYVRDSKRCVLWLGDAVDFRSWGSYDFVHIIGYSCTLTRIQNKDLVKQSQREPEDINDEKSECLSHRPELLFHTSKFVSLSTWCCIFVLSFCVWKQPAVKEITLFIIILEVVLFVKISFIILGTSWKSHKLKK